MRLSVILPFYDETAFVHMAVQSVLSQGIDGAEILIVNDNPERFPPGWLESQGFAPQVRILHHDVNRGLSAARNTGMAAAQGRIIGFLDSDDYYLTDGLTDQLALAESSGADMTHAGACISQPGTPALKVLPRDAALFSRARSGAGLAGIEEAQFITSSWSSLYRRDFLDGHGLRFDPEQVKFEDRLFVLQSVTRSGRIAVLGRPVRCWRRRAGSISVTPPDEGILRLQVQLLEKCMAVMRAHGQGAGIPARFLKREVFNTVSRLIWDMELIRLAVEAPTDTTRELAARVAALLGDDRLGQPIFDDPVLRRISRVGQPSRHGVIGRADFFDLHKALRSGDMVECRAILRARQAPAPVPARAQGRGGALDGRRLVLHLGLHKTASTWLQRQLLDQAPTLRARGILVPQAGLPGPDFRPVRPGGFPGHQGLLAALRRGDEAPWAALGQEVAASGCGTVVFSCENMALPTDPDRDALLARLFLRLGGARDVRVVAFVRSPDTWAEAYWAEQVCNGLRAGARTLPEFLVDHGDSLTDLPALFAPFEVFAGAPVRLADHDAAAAAPGGHWAAFAEMAGLDLPPLPPGALARAYPGPDRAQIQAALALNALIAAEPLRARTLRAFFAVPAEPGSRASFLPPQARRALLTRFAERSADWAAARGYRPDLAARDARLAAEDWAEPAVLPVAVLDRLRIARLQAEHDPPPARRMTEAEPEPAPDLPGKSWGDDGVILRVRLRPWARRALARLGLGRAG